jgi:PAS domain S-box-containing protein
LGFDEPVSALTLKNIMTDKYRIIHLEDTPSDAELAARALKKGSINFEHLVVDTEADYVHALDTFSPDIILCDHSLPAFNSFEALKILRAKNLAIPFILITGQMSEEIAAGVVEVGADDYILKDRITRLPNAVLNAIEKHRYERERNQLVSQAKANLSVTNKLLTNLSDKLVLALKAASIGTWEYDIHHNKFVADENMDAIYGTIPVSFDGLIKFIHEDDKERVSKELMDALLKHSELHSEFRIVQPGGSIRYIKGQTTIQRDASGFATTIIGINQDVTSDKEAERAVKESEAKYRAFFENSMDAILLTDPNGKIYAANHAACSIFQCSEEDIYNGGRAAFLDVSDKRLPDLLEERSRTGRAKGEITFIRKNGERFPGEVSSALFTDAYGNERTSMIIRDVSERKIAEERIITTSKALADALGDLQKIMDSSLDVICTIDAEGRFVNVSSAAERVWGYTPEELAGKLYMDFVHVSDHQKTIEIAGAIMSGTPVTVFENHYVHKDGRSIPILWSAQWDFSENLMFCIAKDASEKKRLEREFDYERQRFSELFLKAPSAVAVLNGPGHIFEMANPLYHELVGKPDIIGKRVLDALPEVVDQGFIELLDTVYSTGQTFHAKEMLAKLYKKGSVELVDKYLNFIYEPNKNSEGIVEGIFVFVIDVTEQVQARKNIEESNERFEIVSTVTNDAIWDWNLKTNEVYWNHSYEKLFGYPAIAKNTNIDQWLNAVHDDDKHRVNTAITNVINNKGKTWQEEYRYVKANGDIAYVDDRGYLVYDEENNAVRFLGAMHDITDRKLSEEKLQEYQEQLLESQRIAHIGSFQLKLTHLDNIMRCPLSCSEETYNIFNLAQNSEHISIRSFYKLVHPEDSKVVKDVFKNALTKRSSYGVDFRVTGIDGKETWVHFQAKVIRDTVNDQPLKMFGTVKNITLRKEQELQIKKSTEEREILIAELTRSLNDLKQFAYITSHNFRAPLSNLIGLLGLINFEDFSEENRNFLNMFKTSTLQLSKTINDLIQILIIKNNASISCGKIVLSQAVAETINLFSGEILEAGCQVETNLEVANIVFNKSYLDSVLINLLSNAIKYRSPHRSLIVKIATYINADGYVVLSVADNGLGIDLQRHGTRIFGLYQRFHSNADGAGLGLFMVKSQMESLGATISVESQVEKGTTFYITFKEKNRWT